METETKPRVYVGTYAKYNSGSLKGKWLDLEDFADHEDFLAACRKLHKDEKDPELMFQDFEGFPKDYYGESGLKPELWDWIELEEEDRELLAIYADHVGDSPSIEDARENFAGKANTVEDWAEEFSDETGLLQEVPENLRCYFDWEKYARDLQYGGDIFTVEKDGEVWVFWNR